MTQITYVDEIIEGEYISVEHQFHNDTLNLSGLLDVTISSIEKVNEAIKRGEGIGFNMMLYHCPNETYNEDKRMCLVCCSGAVMDQKLEVDRGVRANPDEWVGEDIELAEKLYAIDHLRRGEIIKASGQLYQGDEENIKCAGYAYNAFGAYIVMNPDYTESYYPLDELRYLKNNLERVEGLYDSLLPLFLTWEDKIRIKHIDEIITNETLADQVEKGENCLTIDIGNSSYFITKRIVMRGKRGCYADQAKKISNENYFSASMAKACRWLDVYITMQSVIGWTLKKYTYMKKVENEIKY